MKNNDPYLKSSAETLMLAVAIFAVLVGVAALGALLIHLLKLLGF